MAPHASNLVASSAARGHQEYIDEEHFLAHGTWLRRATAHGTGVWQRRQQRLRRLGHRRREHRRRFRLRHGWRFRLGYRWYGGHGHGWHGGRGGRHDDPTAPHAGPGGVPVFVAPALERVRLAEAAGVGDCWMRLVDALAAAEAVLESHPGIARPAPARAARGSLAPRLPERC